MRSSYAQPALSGGEIAVNTTTANSQQNPDIASGANGKYIVVWESFEQDGDDYGIYGKLYNEDGTVAKGEFLINTTTAYGQRFPSVGMNANGDFVVVWMSDGQDGSGHGIYAQQFGADGSPTDTEFLVNTTTAGQQRFPKVAVAGTGEFVITWESDSDVSAQRYASDGNAAGNEFTVNSTTADQQAYPAIDIAPDASFVITWQSFGQDGDGFGVYAQRFGADGTALGSETKINTTNSKHQIEPDIAIRSTGDYMITWSSYGQDGDNYGIYMQQFTADGTALYSETQLNSQTANGQRYSAVAANEAGYAIIWTTESTDGTLTDIKTQWFTDFGWYIGSETFANTTTANRQENAVITFSPSNQRNIVAWQNGLINSTSTSDGSDYGITLQSFVGVPNTYVYSSASGFTNEPFVVNITFSEDVSGFEVSDLTVSNGAAGGFGTSNAKSYYATITPSNQGNVQVSIAADVAVDGSSNGNLASGLFEITYDNIKPSISITSAASLSTNASSFDATFTFSEAVTGFEIEDIIVSNGTASAFNATSTTVYTATITPTVDGTVTVDVNTDAAQDVATNGNTAATQFVIDYDASDPTIALSTSTGVTANSPFTVTFTFVEPVTGFDVTDIQVSNGSVGSFNAVSTSEYTALITPASEGAVTVDVAADVAQDNAGNNNAAASQLSIIYDATSPTITITSTSSGSITAPFDVTFTFSEEVSSFELSDIAVGNGTASAFNATSASEYTATITPTGDGLVTVDVGENTAQDEATNGNTAAAQFSVTYDTTSPQVVIMSAISETNAAFDVTFLFTEPVTGFDLSDIQVSGGSAGSFSVIDSKTYSATITPAAEGMVTVDVNAYAAQDAAGNNSVDAIQLIVIYDNTRPTVSIGSMASGYINSDFTVTFTFSENVEDFNEGDIAVINAVVNDFNAISFTEYTATISPFGAGEVTVGVPMDQAHDYAGNGNEESSEFSIQFDNSSPSVVITSTAPNPINDVFEVTITFDEPVNGFDFGDVQVSNGSVGTLNQESIGVFKAAILPLDEGVVLVDVLAGVAQDEAGNGNSEAMQFMIQYDNVKPTVAITSSASGIISSSFSSIFTFSEAVTGFDLNDIVVFNGTASDFNSISTTEYSATITPDSDGMVTVDLTPEAAYDVANNSNKPSDPFMIVFDATKPTITITSAVSVATNNAFLATFTFSEDVMGFDLSDIQVTNGTAGTFNTTNAATYTAIISPTAPGIVYVNVNADVASDNAGYGNTAATEFSISYDNTVPGLVISSSAPNPINGPFLTIFTFSKAVTGFDLADIVVGNGTVSSFNATSTTVYSATITPIANGSVTVDVSADAAQDGFGNGNSGAIQFSTTYDGTAPTVVITSTSTNSTNTFFTTTYTFSEPVAGFNLADIQVSNGSAGSFGTVSSSVYTAVITPAGSGTVTVNVAANVAQDNAGNSNTVASQLSIVYDVTSPTIAITSTSSGLINTAFDVTFTFSEDVTGFDINDIALSNGTASAFNTTSASVYTATITPTVNGLATVTVSANAASDNAGNGNIAATQFSVNYDNSEPSVVISSTASLPTNTAFMATFTFSEAVTGFDVTDILLGNASASAFNASSSTVYTATITPTANGSVTVDVNAGVAQDAATNGNLAASQFSLEYDNTQPAIVISGSVTSPTNSAFTATFTFSESITGFDLGDIEVYNATKSAFNAVSTTVYTAIINPSQYGLVKVNVASNVAQDAATNGNTAATEFGILHDNYTWEPTVSNISDDSGTNGSDQLTNDNTLVISGTAEGGSTVQVFLDASSIGATTADGDGDWNFDYTATSLSDAIYAVTAKGTDVAGNVSGISTALSVTVDTTPPDSPTISIINDRSVSVFGENLVTGDNTFEIYGESEAGGHIIEVFIDGSSIGTILDNGYGEWNFDYSAVTLSDGTYAVTAKATDRAGNDGLIGDPVFVTVDTSAPDAPVITGISDDNGPDDSDGITNDNILIVNGTSEANAQIRVFIGSEYSGFTTANGSGDWSLDTDYFLREGDYSITATARDAAFNESSTSAPFEVTIDLSVNVTSVNTISIDSGPNGFDEITNDNTLIFNGWAGSTNSTVTVYIDAISIGTTTVNESGFWSFDHTDVILADGEYTIGSAETDLAGNIGPMGFSLAITIDTAAPDAPVISAISDDTGSDGADGITNDNILIIDGNAEANNSVEVFVNGSSIGSTEADASGNWSFDSEFTDTILSDNTYSITAKATDVAGNTSVNSTGLSVTVDTTSPVVVVSTISNDTGLSGTDGITNDNTLSIAGTAEAGNQVEVFIDATSIGTIAANESGDWSFDHTDTSLTDGTYSITANATDVAGNTSSLTTALSVTVDKSAPSVIITSLATNPTNGPFITTFAFSEAVTGFAIEDITVSNGVASNFVASSTSVYTATIIPSTDGQVSVNVGANAAIDIAGNGNSASVQFSMNYDATSPTVVISTSATEPVSSSFSVTFTFSEVVSNLKMSDIQLENAAIASLSNEGSGIYTALINLLTTGDVIISLPASSCFDEAGNGNSSSDNFSIAAQIIKIDPVIKWANPEPISFGQALGDDQLNASSDLSGTFVYTPEAGNILNAGTHTLSVDFIPDDAVYHNGVTGIEVEITVSKADQSITFDALTTKRLGDEPFELIATASSGLSVSYSSSDETVATVSGKTVTIVGAGTTTITASQAGNKNFKVAAGVQQDLTIEKQGQTISFEAPSSKKFGEPSFELTATASSGLEVSFASSDENVATISGATVTIVGAGTATITATQKGNNNYRQASPVTNELVVNKASQAITLASIPDKATDSRPFDVAASASSGLGVNLAVAGPASIDGNTVTLAGTAGTVTVTASQPGSDNFKAADDVLVTFEVTTTSVLQDQTIAFDPIQDKTFGNEPFELVATASSGLAISFASSDENVISISGNTATIIGAGSATITATQAGDAAYNAASSEQTLVVNKKVATITITDLEFTADGTPKVPTVATDPTGLNTVVSYDGSSDAPIQPGSYQVTVDVQDTNFQGNATATMIISEPETTAVVKDAFGQADVYPNPAFNVITVKSKKAERLYIHTLDGKMVLDVAVKDGQTLDISVLVRGLYMVTLTDRSGDKSWRKKLIKY